MTADPIAAAPRELRLDAPAIGLALLAALAALAAGGILPEAALPWCAGPALCLASALPLVARCLPAPADRLQLATYTFVLSPLLSAALWGSWHLFLDGRAALCACAATVALLHLASLGCRASGERGLRAPLAVLALGAALAALAAACLLRGSAARLAEPDVVRAAVALSVERAVPPAHPWIAGEPWTRVWGAELATAFHARALGIAPTRASALLAVLASLLAPAGLWLLAQSAWVEARRRAFALAFALSAAAVPFAGDTGFHGLEPLLQPGPSAFALALSLAALAAAARALKARHWGAFAMCAVLHGAGLMFEFATAWPAACASLVLAVSPLCDAHARPRLLLALALAVLPGLALTRALDSAWSAAVPGPEQDGIAGAVGWMVLAAVSWIPRRWALLSPDHRGILLPLAAGAAGLIGARAAGAWTDPDAARSMALWALGLAAAGVVPVSRFLATARHWFPAALGASLALLGALPLASRIAVAWELAGRDHPLLAETARALEPASAEASAVDLRAALAFLRDEGQLRRDRAVLLACPRHNPYRETRDLPEHALAACAGLGLYGDVAAGPLAGQPEAEPRSEALVQLFQRAGGLDASLLARAERAGARAVVALVREEDSAFTPGLGGKLERLGFARWREFRGVALYVGPRAAAERYVQKP